MLRRDRKINSVRSMNWPAAHFEPLELRCMLSALTLDPSFATAGTYVKGFPPTPTQGFSSYVLPNGKIIVSGGEYLISPSGGPPGSVIDGVLFRLSADGSLDTTFGDNGITVTPDCPGGDRIAVDANGNIYLSTYLPNSSSEPAIERFTADGMLDNSFGVNGVASADFATAAGSDFINAGFVALAVENDGTIVGVGEMQLSNTTGDAGDIAIACFNPNGSLKSSFGNNGTLTLSFGDPDSNAYQTSAATVAIDQNGKIVVGGTLQTFTAPDNNANTEVFAVARLNADGTLDTTFDGSGYVLTSFQNAQPAASWATIVQIFPNADGSILAIGNSWANEVLAARYDADGSLDTGFGTGGLMSVPFSGALVTSAKELPSGGFAVAGGSGVAVGGEGTPLAWARFSNTGNLLDSALSSPAAPSEVFSQLSFTADGSIIGVGAVSSSPDPNQWYGTYDLIVAKYDVTADSTPQPPAPTAQLGNPAYPPLIVTNPAPPATLPPPIRITQPLWPTPAQTPVLESDFNTNSGQEFAGQVRYTDVAGSPFQVAWSTTLPVASTTTPALVVHWGDGTQSGASIEMSPTGQVDATATHAYRKAGVYHPVAVFEEDGKVIRRVRERIVVHKFLSAAHPKKSAK